MNHRQHWREIMNNKKRISLPTILWKGYKKPIVFIFCVAAISSITEVFSVLYIGKSIDFIVGKNNVQYVGLIKALTTLLVLYVLSAFSNWMVHAMSNRIANSVARDLRHNTFDKITKLPLSYFDQNPHGDILSRFTNDINSISDALSIGLVNMFIGIVTVITVLVLMLVLNIKLTFVVLLVTPINFIVAWVQAKVSRDTFMEQQTVIGDLTGFVSERVGNQKTLSALGYENENIKQFEVINKDLNRIGTKAQFSAAVVNPTTRVVDHLSYILVGIVGAFIAITTKNISIGTISSFLLYSGLFAKPFNEISGIMANLQTAAAAMQRIDRTLNEREEVAELPNAITLSDPDGKIEFKNVDFSYIKSRPLIKDLNIQANPGELVAIVGPTGAGKTTIVNLLMRFYEINKGSIEIDNHNIISYTKDSLRRSFGMVLQETWLFHGTIRDNIKYGNPHATEDDMIEASKAAYAHNFISKFPDGYDTLIAEDGGNLSQGQKQLLTIARVMLTDPSLLILDEATSSIDSLTEIRVQSAFMKLMNGRTSFVIAHRLSTIINADLILVLDKGQVIETGTHKELLDKRGFYYSLYQSQFE